MVVKMMKAYLEIVELKNDVVTTSCTEDCPCDFGCGTDMDQLAE